MLGSKVELAYTSFKYFGGLYFFKSQSSLRDNTEAISVLATVTSQLTVELVIIRTSADRYILGLNTH